MRADSRDKVVPLHVPEHDHLIVACRGDLRSVWGKDDGLDARLVSPEYCNLT